MSEQQTLETLRQLHEIQRQLLQKDGYPHDLGGLIRTLKNAVRGDFEKKLRLVSSEPMGITLMSVERRFYLFTNTVQMYPGELRSEFSLLELRPLDEKELSQLLRRYRALARCFHLSALSPDDVWHFVVCGNGTIMKSRAFNIERGCVFPAVSTR